MPEQYLYRVRRATVHDVSEIQRMAQLLLESDKAWDNTIQIKTPYYATERGAQELGRLIRATGKTALCLVAEDLKTANVVAYATASISQYKDTIRGGDVAHVENLFVAEEHRRRKIGGQLLGEVNNWRNEQGIPYLDLRVLADNVAAVSLYERAGFSCRIQEMTYRQSTTQTS